MNIDKLHLINHIENQEIRVNNENKEMLEYFGYDNDNNNNVRINNILPNAS